MTQHNQFCFVNRRAGTVRIVLSTTLLLICLLGGSEMLAQNPVTTPGGTANFVAKFTGSTVIGNSAIFEKGGNVGIGTTAPSARLQVAGNAKVGGSFNVGSTLTSTGSIFTPANLTANGVVSGGSGSFLNGISVGGQVFAGSGQFAGNVSAGGSLSSFSANFTGGISAVNITTSGSGNFGKISGLNISAVQGAFNAFATGTALSTQNNNTSQTIQVQNVSTPANNSFELAMFNANGKAVFFVDTLGDMAASGSKSAFVSLQDGQHVKLFAMESPENWFEDFGSGTLIAGVATIQIDPKFAQTVNLGTEYHVFLTPTSDSQGLFVTQKTPTSFEVRESGGGRANVSFDYPIVARRSGYEKLRMPVTKLPKLAAENLQR